MRSNFHELKLLYTFENDILDGLKTFEVRENDRGFQKGDLIKFKVVDTRPKPSFNHPIENKVYEITYVLNGWGIKNGYVVFGIKEQIAENTS